MAGLATTTEVDIERHALAEGISLLSGRHVLAEHCNSNGRGTPYLTGPADFPDGRICHSKSTDRPTTICQTNDILVTVKGSGAGSLVLADGKYCISRQLMAIRVEDWDTRYVYYSLLNDSQAIQAASTGLIPGLSRADILGNPTLIPPTVNEQRAIAEALSDVDALINALDALIAKKRHIKQGTMQQLLTGKKRLPGFSPNLEPQKNATPVPRAG